MDAKAKAKAKAKKPNTPRGTTDGKAKAHCVRADYNFYCKNFDHCDIDGCTKAHCTEEQTKLRIAKDQQAVSDARATLAAANDE